MGSYFHLISSNYSLPIPHDIIKRTLSTPLGEAAYKVVETLMDAAFECLWVGGAVRDMMLGAVPKEVDIATSAAPEQIEKLFKKTSMDAAHFGSVIVSLHGHEFEITTFREDHPISDGRRPSSITYSTKEQDALRRDATINAMYWNPITRELFDPCKGSIDISERLVRFIGEPQTRIREDALRILRMVRLRATIDGQYEPATYAALSLLSGITSALSGLRIIEELDKLLGCPRPALGLEDLWELGVLKHILPELAICKGIAQPAKFHREGDVWNHLLNCTRHFTPDHGADVRLAALLHDTGKATTFSITDRIHFDKHAEASADTASTMLKRLQVPGERIRKIDWLIRHHMMMNAFSTLSEVRKAHWYFHPWFVELLGVFYLDAAGTDPGDFKLYDWIVDDYNKFLNEHPRPEKPLLSGHEIMEILGVHPGAIVGDISQKLQEAQVRKEVQTKVEAREFVKDIYHERSE